MAKARRSKLTMPASGVAGPQPGKPFTMETAELPNWPEGLQARLLLPTGTAPASGWPLAIAWHGRGGTVNSMVGVCKRVFLPVQVACVTVDPLGQNRFSQILEWFSENTNAMAYPIDVQTIFTIAYSLGGYTIQRWLEEGSSPYRSSLKGIIEDSSSPPFNNSYIQDIGMTWWAPPMLLMHCENDKTMGYSWTFKKLTKQLTSFNEQRASAGKEQAQFHGMKWEKATKCTHKQRTRYATGEEAVQTFVTNILQQLPPFEGLAKTVKEVDA